MLNHGTGKQLILWQCNPKKHWSRWADMSALHPAWGWGQGETFPLPQETWQQPQMGLLGSVPFLDLVNPHPPVPMNVLSCSRYLTPTYFQPSPTPSKPCADWAQPVHLTYPWFLNWPREAGACWPTPLGVQYSTFVTLPGWHGGGL